MVNAIAVQSHDSGTINEIIRMYEELARFHQFPPTLELIRLHYLAHVDTKILELRVSLYGDDFYDGAPGKTITKLPDAFANDIETYIDIPLTIKEEQIHSVLNQYALVHADEHRLYNSPLQEVW